MVGIGGVLLAFAAAVETAPAHAADDDLVVTGSGWGHGVGLSQYGAYGMALDGVGYRDILTHFYRDTGLGTLGGGLPAAPVLWVNLEMGKSDLVLRPVATGSQTPRSVVIRRGGEVLATVGAGTRVEVDGPTDCRLVIRRTDGSVTTTPRGACAFDLSWDGGASNPTTAVAVEGCTQTVFTAAGTSTVECRYARGQLRVRPRSGRFDLSATMTLEQYLLGIAEMPYSWGSTAMAALQAQAVAARSYARELQITRGSHDPTQNPGNSCVAWCHVRDTTFDQRYVGWGQEDPRWRQAVTSTADRVVTHPSAPNGRIVRAYYSSSSGGRTENIEEVWDQPARPYLRSVGDPWATRSSVNPFASWTVRLGNVAVARAIGLDRITEAVVVQRHTSGSAAAIRFVGVAGGQITTFTRTGAWLRSSFGLRSIYFSVGAGSRFGDVSGNVHIGAINAISELGITKGCNPPVNDRYCPERPVTRGQMAAFLVRALRIPATDRDFFTDDAGTTFEDDINRLAAAGVTFGCNPPGNSRFCPDRAVTRGQMAAFLDRAFGYTAGGDVNRFSDDNDSIFEESINRIAAAGITYGCNPPANTRYCPGDDVRRDQMASFLSRAVTGLD